MSVLSRMPMPPSLSSATSVEQRYVYLITVGTVSVLTIWQRKANGVDISIDASELEGMSEEELRRRYDQGARGSAGVPGANGREDFSEMIAKEMAKKKQKMDRERESRKEKDFKF